MHEESLSTTRMLTLATLGRTGAQQLVKKTMSLFARDGRGLSVSSPGCVSVLRTASTSFVCISHNSCFSVSAAHCSSSSLTPPQQQTPSYSYVIIGAGSAGCVLANRLTEDAHESVLLLEAGPKDKWLGSTRLSWKVHMPAALTYNLCDDKYSNFTIL